MAWERDFTVPAQIDRAWEVFGDVRVLAHCLPGLTGIEPERDRVRARLRFRAGSNQVTYAGTIAPQERTSDELTVAASGTEARGDGEVAVSVRIRLRPSGTGTSVRLAVTPSGSGRVTGFDAAAVRDAGERLLDRFVAAVGERFPEPAAVQSELPADSVPPTQPADSVPPTEPADSEPPTERESPAEPQPAAEPEPPAVSPMKPVREAPVIEVPTPAAAVAWRARAGAGVAVLLGIVALWFLRRRAES